jgi:hypothetical protein
MDLDEKVWLWLVMNCVFCKFLSNSKISCDELYITPYLLLKLAVEFCSSPSQMFPKLFE